MVILPLAIMSQEIDSISTRATKSKSFLYDLGITIEPARESAPLHGIGVANPSLVPIVNQLDSLSSAFLQYKKMTDSQLDSLWRENQRLQNLIFLSPHATLSPPIRTYSKKEGERFFQKGHDAYLARNYAVAVDYFTKTIASEAASSMIGDAYYWIGNSYIQLHDEYLALEYLKKVVEYPLSENVDDALFLTAITYRKLGNKELATIFFKRLLQRFPGGQLAKLADLELKRLETIE